MTVSRVLAVSGTSRTHQALLYQMCNRDLPEIAQTIVRHPPDRMINKRNSARIRPIVSFPLMLDHAEAAIFTIGIVDVVACVSIHALINDGLLVNNYEGHESREIR